MALSLRSAALSDVGRVRRDNQDSGYAGAHLLVIADGVGGAARGDVASSAAVDALRKLDVPPGNDALSELSATIHLAHDRIAEIVEHHPELDGTSTTVTAAIFDGTHLRVGHVGDSRGYLLRDGELRPLTTDHTLVQSLIDEGRITEEEARVHPHRNLILRAVDGVHDPEPDLSSVDVVAGDRVLLCSDGCSGVLDNGTMADLMSGPLEEAAQRLVRSALDAGSSDNVTVILADVLEGDLDPAAESAPGLVVGAAASSPHLRMNEATGNLTERDLLELGEQPDFDPGYGGEFDPDYDPEDLRYAPRPPRRFTWVRRLAVLAVFLGLVGYGAYAVYDWSQDQYYVGLDGDTVVVYQGVDIPMLNQVESRTTLQIDNLPAEVQAGVRSGLAVDDLDDARRKVASLRQACVEAIEVPPRSARPPYLPVWLQTDAPRQALVAEKCPS